MDGMDATVAARLGLAAAQDGGFVGDRGGALVHLRHVAGPPSALKLVVSVRSLSGELPPLDGALADLQEAGELTVEKAGSAATMEIADPDSYDPEALADALGEWISGLVAVDLVPQVKCDSCMVRDGLTVVARDGRAIRQCSDCLSRQQADDVPGLREPVGAPASAAGMAMAAQPAEQSDTVSPSHEPRRADGDHGNMHYLARAAIFLPVAALASAVIWLGLWYAWDSILERMADAEGNVSMPKLALVIVSAIIGALTAAPLAVAIRKSRIYSFITTWLPAILFGLPAILLGEVLELVRWAYAETGEFHPLAVLHIWSYWTSMSGFYLFSKVIIAGVTIYFIAYFSDPTSSED